MVPAALAAGPGHPERARYLFRAGPRTRRREPPNNWQSVFGGPAWTRVVGRRTASGTSTSSTPPSPTSTGATPRCGDVRGVLRFWLDRGVDGFRIDVAHGLFKEPSLRDQGG